MPGLNLRTPSSTMSVQSKSTESEQVARSKKDRQREKLIYARTRANACMELTQDLGNVSTIWHSQGVKSGIELFKTSSSWKSIPASRATTTIFATLPHIVQVLFESCRCSENYQHIWRSVFSHSFLHAEIVDNLVVNPSLDQRATLKWYALQPSKLRRPVDYFVVEWIGIIMDENDSSSIQSCYLYQESLADIGGLRKSCLQSLPYDRDQLDAVLVKFDKATYGSTGVQMTVIVQKSATILDLPFAKTPAAGFALQLARGLHDALQTTPSVSSRARACHHCARAFHIFRRGKHACSTCSRVICHRAACAATCPIPSFTRSSFPSLSGMTDKQLLAVLQQDRSNQDISTEARERLQTRIPDDFNCASAWSLHEDVNEAVQLALASVRQTLPEITFMAVYYSSHVDAAALRQSLQQLAPDVPFVGGTIGRGICDNEAWVASSKRTKSSLVCIFGIWDPHGSYIVDHIEYDSLPNALQETRDLVQRNNSQADFSLVFATPLFIEPILSELQSLNVVGGCATDASHDAWNQISSLKDSVTNNGLTIALCTPSIVTHRSWFTGHGVLDTTVPKIVTQVDPSKTKVITLDNESAASVYAKWLGPTRWSASSFPRVGNTYPLALISNSPHVSQTRVVLDAEISTGILSLSNTIEVGTAVRVLEINRSTLSKGIKEWGIQVQEMDQVRGCMMFFSTSVQILLGSQRMAEMVGEYRKWSSGGTFLGLSTFGQIGGSTPTYDPLMFSAILFTDKKRIN